MHSLFISPLRGVTERQLTFLVAVALLGWAAAPLPLAANSCHVRSLDFLFTRKFAELALFILASGVGGAYIYK